VEVDLGGRPALPLPLNGNNFDVFNRRVDEDEEDEDEDGQAEAAGER